MKHRVRYITKAEQIEGISDRDRAILQKVSQRYVFRANDYYLGLIDWSDPADPIKRIIIPEEHELDDWGRDDASNEAAVTVEKGVQHKYADTALLLCNEVCGAYCRYCFRKRLFMNDNDETSRDVSAGIEYIRSHPEITDVLLTGGDPLIMSARRLGEIIGQVRSIPHIHTVRIGSKMPAFNPYRLLEDEALHEVFRQHSGSDGRIYLMTHFDHPRELTEPAVEGLLLMQKLGVQTVNQCPILKGVNDDVDTLVAMWEKLTDIGCPQYYVFQCRPTSGNAPYSVPIVRGFEMVDEARKRVSGLSRRARFAMSHATGKVEVVGLDATHIYCRYHRAKNWNDQGRMLVYHRDDNAHWLDDLRPANAETPAARKRVGHSLKVLSRVETKPMPENGNGNGDGLRHSAARDRDRTHR